MADTTVNTMQILNKDYLQRYPDEALHTAAELDGNELAELVRAQSIQIATRVWDSLPPEIAADVIDELGDSLVKQLLTRSDPVHTDWIQSEVASVNAKTNVLQSGLPSSSKEGVEKNCNLLPNEKHQPCLTTYNMQQILSDTSF